MEALSDLQQATRVALIQLVELLTSILSLKFDLVPFVFNVKSFVLYFEVIKLSAVSLRDDRGSFFQSDFNNTILN